LYTACLKSGKVITPRTNRQRSSDEDIPRPRSKKTKTTLDKTSAKLKSWCPNALLYPIGFIPVNEWLHMNDLPFENQFHFELDRFRSKPDYKNQNTYEYGVNHKRSCDYDYVYYRLHSSTTKSPRNGKRCDEECLVREIYCGICDAWFTNEDCAYLQHMKNHGIRSSTKSKYPLPYVMAKLPTNSTKETPMYIGFCDRCVSWQNINPRVTKFMYSSWFIHQAE
jgi:hypothetical protein